MTYKITIQAPDREVVCLKCIDYNWQSDSVIDITICEGRTLRASVHRVDYIEIEREDDKNES